ncbi:hypothetical protein LO763_21135 [Glycomyces sp. A-F 0318]|uniref:hypothetical protein n=1 Tax=Glycomyces amatae TaxID=2881355 RepID=UPI001E2C427D|nr:hypothetical protein [Glycomyces amatae]MCD0446120.1 hypothetical protein [Glycomyces amatae]
MTDELFGDEGEFDEAFFASLAANPDDPVADDPPDAGLEDLLGDGDAFLYEAEGDGSFETDTAGFDDESFDADPEPDFDFHDEGDPGSGPDADRDFDTGS